MATNFKDSYYALKSVGIGFNIATIAKNIDFWSMEVKNGGQWPPIEKIKKTAWGDWSWKADSKVSAR